MHNWVWNLYVRLSMELVCTIGYGTCMHNWVWNLYAQLGMGRRLASDMKCILLVKSNHSNT